MYEPVELQNIMLAVIAGAMVILFGALYALAFAMARLRKQRWLARTAYGMYAGLALCVFVLAKTLNLTGFWWIVTITMLIGYLLAPRAIWKLSVGTHGTSD